MNSRKAYELEHGTDIRPAHEGKTIKFERTKYIFVLDFNDGKVYRYNVRALCNKENEWNPDHESCEAFLLGAGHRLGDCEWMVTNNENIEYGN